MIPIINTFFAVGLVSLPGMMTGQILAGVDPLIAVRYQIMALPRQAFDHIQRPFFPTLCAPIQ
jgi:putative ABC transport system permease protein